MALSAPERTSVLHQIAHCYGVEPSQLECLTDNPDDGVYGFTRQGQDFVVKYTLPTMRSYSTLQGQVDWVNYLAEHGAPVSRPVPSRRGLLIEQLPLDDTLVSVVCHTRVPGERPQRTTWTAEFFQNWGQIVGKLHALSSQYTPHPQHGHFEHWNESAARDREEIPADQELVLQKFDALQQYFDALPTDPDAYGVIHGDLQANNLCLDKGRLWVIDFDGCSYHWFIMDIATALYFTLWERPPEQSNAAFAAFVLENMMVGYRREHLLGAGWLERLPTCLKLVEMNIYVAILAYNHVALRSNQEAVPPKHRALLNRYRHNIEHDVPYIESARNPWT